MSGKAESKHPEYIEDIPDKPITIDASLPDERLIEGGLTPVTGWMRTRSSRNAERQRRKKAKAASGEDGKPPRKQLNLEAPIDDAARNALKRVSKQLVEGDLSPGDLDVIGRVDVMRTGTAVHRILAAGGWRAAIMRRLLGPGY
jgi:hypothetical protein